MPDQVVIVGGGVAAMRCAFELRERGFDGHLSMLCAESTPPYDRTLVSKALISGAPVDAERLLLQSLEAYNDAGIELRLGVGATALEAADRRLVLGDGSCVAYDRLVLAVGGEPARPAPLMADGVVTLRDLGDARRLEPALDAAERVVIIGGGFIGTEVASIVAARGLDATIVDAALPFAPLLGERVAERICAMHRARGVTLLTGTPVDRVKRAGPAFHVDLADGRHVPADAVVVAVGMRPATRWLDRSALRASRGVPVDPGGRTGTAGVFATWPCRWAAGPSTSRPRLGQEEFLAQPVAPGDRQVRRGVSEQTIASGAPLAFEEEHCRPGRQFPRRVRIGVRLTRRSATFTAPRAPLHEPACVRSGELAQPTLDPPGRSVIPGHRDWAR
jgi:NAD(P)H-nitrite reductase large subunit